MYCCLSKHKVPTTKLHLMSVVHIFFVLENCQKVCIHMALPNSPRQRLRPLRTLHTITGNLQAPFQKKSQETI